MKALCALFIATGVLLFSSESQAAAGTIAIAQTPILNTALPAGSTYQVEFSTNGTTWISTGVLVAGNGASNSVRLDGLPENAAYRLSGVGSVATVTPSISNGLHLRPSFAGASELHIESASQFGVAGWTNRAFAFTDLQGEFIAPLGPPLTGAEFFRAVQPATPLATALVTAFAPDTNATYAGYGIVADDMPQLYRAGYIAAPCPTVYHRDGANAAAAGECYELVGPQGKTTVMVAEIANDSLPNTCDVGRAYFDIGFAAFTNLFTPEVGYGPVTFRLVPAPVIENIKMVCVVNSGGFYVELRPYNHRAGVSKLEVQATANGPWIDLLRTAYNSFVYNSATPLAVPFNARITSRFGEVITFPTITSLTTGSRFTANGQFTIFPDQGPSPVWIIPPVYAEGFTNNMGTPWIASSASLNPTYTGSAYQGSYSLQITNMAPFGSVSFFAPLRFPSKTDGFLEFAIRSEAAAITSLIARIQGYDATGAGASSSIVQLPSIDGSWRVLRIPLAPTGPPAQIYSLFFQNVSGSTTIAFDLDSISFR